MDTLHYPLFRLLLFNPPVLTSVLLAAHQSLIPNSARLYSMISKTSALILCTKKTAKHLSLGFFSVTGAGELQYALLFSPASSQTLHYISLPTNTFSSFLTTCPSYDASWVICIHITSVSPFLLVPCYSETVAKSATQIL